MFRRRTSREALLDALARHVSDERVLGAMAEVPRTCFVPEALLDRAWDNGPLPIGEGQTISQPLVVARMCEVLELAGDETVLDVGTGSGYHAAVLARLAARVISIERHRALSERAAGNLRAAGVAGVELVVGDGAHGHPPAAPYDAINVAASSAGDAPPALVEQLAAGGRLVIRVETADQRPTLFRRHAGGVAREQLERVRFVPLVREPAR